MGIEIDASESKKWESGQVAERSMRRDPAIDQWESNDPT
jgi:hypothetical protein